MWQNDAFDWPSIFELVYMVYYSQNGWGRLDNNPPSGSTTKWGFHPNHLQLLTQIPPNYHSKLKKELKYLSAIHFHTVISGDKTFIIFHCSGMVDLKDPQKLKTADPIGDFDQLCPWMLCIMYIACIPNRVGAIMIPGREPWDSEVWVASF